MTLRPQVSFILCVWIQESGLCLTLTVLYCPQTIDLTNVQSHITDFWLSLQNFNFVIIPWTKNIAVHLLWVGVKIVTPHLTSSHYEQLPGIYSSVFTLTLFFLCTPLPNLSFASNTEPPPFFFVKCEVSLMNISMHKEIYKSELQS